MSLKLSGVILTKNEEKNIERCLKSLEFCDEVIVIDDYSEDRTIDEVYKVKKFIKLKSLKVYKRHLNGDFSAQRNFGMEKARGEWVLFIDVDEEMTGVLRNEISFLIQDQPPRFSRRYAPPQLRGFYSAYYIKRRDWFWGGEVKFGEIPRWIGLIRLVRKNSGKWEGKVHEVFKTTGKTGKLQNYIVHRPHPTVKEFLSEINFYSTLRAEELFQQGKKTNIFEIILYPFGKFFLIYFLKLGFLDGASGFVYAFMMSFHSFLVRTKLCTRIKTNKKANRSE